MGDSDTSSDFDDVQHVTLRRARPPQGRRGVLSPRGAARAPPPPAPPPPPPPAAPDTNAAAWDSSDGEGEGEGEQQGAEAKPAGAEFAKGQSVWYKSRQGAVQATVVVVDMLTDPASYIIRLEDASERSTEASRLSTLPPPPDP
eukprot:Hpha_TRINITY_DN12134_c1_g1::TRINITY_DN12134_c1_g1_i1::g.81716::m.81716